MADEERLRTQESSDTGRAREEIRRFTVEEFRNTPEFRRFKRGMKKILKMSKVESDQRLKSQKRRLP